jgi:AcrR family transcriptional regulator
VATAVELLDTQGIDGLTMRRLADRLGSGVMSLYWHVDNKEDVFDLALDKPSMPWVSSSSTAVATIRSRDNGGSLRGSRDGRGSLPGLGCFLPPGLAAIRLPR